MKMRLSQIAMLASLLPLVTLSGCTLGLDEKTQTSVTPLHSRLLTLDTHLDTPVHFGREGWSFGDRHDPASDLSQVDIPRMANGNLDGGFFVIFTDQGPLTEEGYATALKFALGRSAEIDQVINRLSDKIQPATKSTDAPSFTRKGTLFAFKSMENSYAIGDNLANLAAFYSEGVRLAGPVHSRNNQFADSATDKPKWNGLSPLGRNWVTEMNRLGIVIDPSHASDAAFDDMLLLSKTPLLLSHSGAKTTFDHPRNLDDVRIRKLAAAGGAICFTSVYLSALNSDAERMAAFGELDKLGEMTPAEQTDLAIRTRKLDVTQPLWSATFETFMAGLLHTISVAGVDHVCIGADWDGGGGLKGFEDVTDLPKITAALKAKGFSDADIAKLWSGNVLRIMQEAEHHARVSRQR